MVSVRRSTTCRSDLNHVLTVHLDNVSKRFRLGAANEYGRLTEALTGGVKRLLLPGIRKPKGGEEASDRLRDGWFWALEDLNLQVQHGEILGIVGRNGAGKSTLLKLLARIITPTSGRVGVRGRVGSLLEVGTGFHPELTGRENVFLNGSILGMSRRDIRSRFDAIVDFADIGAFLDTPVKRYSSGMAVRLAFSVAAHLEPDVLIVDEVLAVGDQAFQEKCIGKARELGRQGRTVLLVSHNLSSVANLCTRAVYLRDGRLVEDGTPSQIIESYLKASVGASGTRRWEQGERPSSREVALNSISIHSGEPTSPPSAEVDIDQSVIVAIEYEVLEDGCFVTPAVRIQDETATSILWSTNADSVTLSKDPAYGVPLGRGVYRTYCTLPTNFLNSVRYFVSVTLGERPGEATVEADKAISFLIHDTGAMRKEYSGHWPGVVRPRLHWNTSFPAS